MEAIGGGNAAASGAGSAATASASSIVGPSGLTGRVGAASAVTSEAEGASADNDADDSVEETGITEEDDEEDEDEAEGKARTDSVSSTGASASKSSGSKHQSPGKMKKRVRLGESEEDPQESTADEDEDDEDDEVADDEDDYEEDEDDDKASAMDVDEDEDDEDDAEDAGRVDVSDSASMLRMVRSLSEEEARRHEQFRRSHFERGAVKRCMAQAIQEASGGDRKVPSVTNVMAIVMAGMTKVFVGEITAEARRIMDKNGETGPIRPRHLREAHRRYYRRRPLARGRDLRRLFR